MEEVMVMVFGHVFPLSLFISFLHLLPAALEMPRSHIEQQQKKVDGKREGKYLFEIFISSQRRN